ncbi:unnamed protein product [Nezara viridula]|uniref:Ion transport domain-containing protein n=1 Tax=Nezara viridula TaxID=85310 RepID=A0A9P0DXZ1_NEZVI|nr:unnamed protein product [Nezara viridula]
MFFKVIAEGPFGYISNGFNVFDGVIVVLSVVELGQTFLGEREGSSGLSVLRTFRLLRILKLVRFMPNLRRQLFVMLRTMDNVAVFFSLLVLFIFIFSILGMNLFGCKFCDRKEGSETCDRKNFDSLLWALVTVFQILTQEDWNVVLFNGMEKTSHWAALYFVALMTFGNYVLFNLLVAILVEGFSSERHERREREQRELAKQQQALQRKYSECYSEDVYSSCSLSEQDSCFQSSQVSIPGMLKVPTLTVNNLNPSQPAFSGRRASVTNNDNSQLTSIFQRRCSWKMSRSSLRRKSRASEDEEQSIMLNNNNHLIASPLHSGEHSHCNGNIETIRNDTQSTRNSQNNRLAAQNAIRNTTEQSFSQQVPWTANKGLARQNSLGAASVCTSNLNQQLLAQPVPQPQLLKVGATHNSSLSIPLRVEDCKSVNVGALCAPTALPKVKEPPPLEPEEEPILPVIEKVFFFLEPKGCLKEREDFSLYVFSPDNRKYNFDDLGKALMSLFVLSSRDGWVNIMYTGLDAVGVDQQPIENYSEWRLLYFIAFILLVGFFVLNMFVGVVVENFHRCREEQEKEERVRRMAKRARQMEKKRKRMHQPPYYTNYSRSRLLVHNVVTSKYFDLAIAAVIGLNVITMAMEFYMMPKELTYALKIFNYFFTAVFILESIMKLVALGLRLYLKDK